MAKRSMPEDEKQAHFHSRTKVHPIEEAAMAPDDRATLYARQLRERRARARRRMKLKAGGAVLGKKPRARLDKRARVTDERR